MVNPQVYLLDLTADASIPNDVMRALIGGNTIVSVPRHDGLIVDMVNEGLGEDVNTSDHITLNTNTPNPVPNTTLQQTSAPNITTMSNTLHNWTAWTTQDALSSDHLPIVTASNLRHDYILQQNRRTFTNYKKQTGHNLQKTQSPLSLRPPYPPTYTLPT